jgi:tyrosine-protein phosphatase SIW14
VLLLYVRFVFCLLLAIAVPGVPVTYAALRLTEWRHFRVVDDGRLYRSGQLTPKVLDRAVHDHGIRTIVCLRALAREGDTRLENVEEIWCAERGIRYVRFAPAAWDSPEGEANLNAFLKLVHDPDAGPVLIHCFAGLHRTGVYCAIFRMELHGWTNAEAIAEMYAIGYFQDDPAALEFLRRYVPRDHRYPAPE